MKNKALYTTLAYCFLILGLILFISGCRSKKSTLDHKTKEVENISIVDKSKIDRVETVQEKSQETKTENTIEKTIEEAWMSFESDKITITDKNGTKTEITNPRFNKGVSKSDNKTKVDVTDAKSEKVAQKEEKGQTDVKIDSEKETTSDLKKTDERKTKIVWLYWIGGIIVVMVLARYGIIKLKKRA